MESKNWSTVNIVTESSVETKETSAADAQRYATYP
jgi:hypothetical protein